MDTDTETKFYVYEFASYFSEQHTLLTRRYRHFAKLVEIGIWTLDCETYFDMIIVQLRALLLDGMQIGVMGGYTVQNFLNLFENGQESLQNIQQMLNEVIIKGASNCDACLVNDGFCCYEEGADSCGCKKGYTVRDAIKIIADKSICHVDNYHRIGGHGWSLIQGLKEILSDCKEAVNLHYIVCVLEANLLPFLNGDYQF